MSLLSPGRTQTLTRLQAIGQAKRSFPYVSVTLQESNLDRSLRTRWIADHAISHLVLPETTADISGPRAADAGFGSRFKLIWQLRGTMRYEDPHRSFTLHPGEMAILAVACNYRLEMDENYEGLLLTFEPAKRRSWQEAVHRETGKAVPASGAIAAAAGGTAALVRHGSLGHTEVPTIESLIDVALMPLHNEVTAATFDQPLPALLFRARVIVAQNVADEEYGPDRLARDLGVSRRSLYDIFGRSGLTPAQFIREQRLQRAKDEIIKEPGVNITTIALRNGFSDASRFSHAFKATYGISPSHFRVLRNKTTPSSEATI
jgi:AraC-like DNA-binding protein